jgi:CRISPR-associated endonuclease Csn1
MPPDDAGRKGLEILDPYTIRAKALDAALTPYELGRALFHLNQRRGFKSNRKADGGKGKESGVIKEGIKELTERMSARSARTLGEYLFMLHRKGKMVRARPEAGFYPGRAMYEFEFDEIQKMQQPHHVLREDQWAQLKDIIFYQRPLKPVDPGWCLLEDGERRAHRALPCAQEFRMVQETANLRIIPERGYAARPLSLEERDKVLGELRTKKELKLEALLKLLKLPADARVNLLDENRAALKGDETSARLSSKGIFGKAWHAKSFNDRTIIVRALLNTEKPEVIEQIAQRDWGLNEENAQKLAAAGLPEGYARLSEKAINKLLPVMEDQGLTYADAVAEIEEYGHHSDFRTDAALDRLPYYGAILTRQVVGGDPSKPKENAVEHYGRLSNPTVHIGLNQVRRVVNRLIEVNGKPEQIVIELARDLKMNREDKENERKKIRENELANKRRNEQFKSANELGSGPYTGPALSPHQMRKLRLWEEQKHGAVHVCPFTGEPISFEMALDDRTEVEHILPFSKTLDDSMANKVLALRAANRIKADRSPHDAFHGNPSIGEHKFIYDDILLRADALPSNKRWRFYQDAMEKFANQLEFLDRQLNETKYLSRIARSYLAHLYNEKAEGRQRVRAIPGKLTAMLRGKWGLNALLGDHNRVGGDLDEVPARKKRDDLRHHAIDAFVIALTDQRLLQKVSALNSDAARTRLIDKIPLPWDGFTPDVLRPHLDRLVVSHKPDHGTYPWMTKDGGGRHQASTSGALHNDTAYGLIEPGRNGSWKVVSRSALTSFMTAEKMDAELPMVRDPALRVALINEWETFKATPSASAPAGEGDASKKLRNPAIEFAHRMATEGLSLSGRKVKVRRVRLVEELAVVTIQDRKSGKPYKAYKPDGNAFADIYALPNGRWTAVVIRTFDANQPDFDPVKYRPHPGAKRMMRLHINDMVAVGRDENRRVLRIVKMSGQNITMADHYEGGALKARDADKADPFKYFAKSAGELGKLGFRKVGVDELGRLNDARLAVNF